jgi:hypothetical protein
VFIRIIPFHTISNDCLASDYIKYHSIALESLFRRVLFFLGRGVYHWKWSVHSVAMCTDHQVMFVVVVFAVVVW